MESIGPLRRFVTDRARKRTEAKVDPLHYPAPFRAIEAIEASFVQSMPKGLDFEARLVGELVPTETTGNLIWLFKNRTALKNAPTGVQASPRPVGRIAVIGAGIMGGGIARLAADHDLSVRLKDLEYEAILTALRTAADEWSRKIDRKRLTRRDLRRRMARIAPTLDDSGMATIDLAVEAVVENLEVKRAVLAAAEQRMPERAVFATNTSSLPIGEIAARALRPERVVGLHFFNPVHRMPLVEVIAGRRSSPEAVATVHALALRLGKVPVVVKDEPGFLVNRILTLYLNESMRLLVEGQRTGNVDRSMTAFGMPVGPLALLDEVGLDTAEHVGQVLRDAFGARIQSENTVLHPMVAAGKVGRKVANGFYRYRNGKRSGPDPAVYGLIGSPAPRELPPETLQERMVLAMINEAAVCLEQGVAREPRDVDLAMVLGTGFPPFRGGLLRHADTIGIPIVVDRLSRLADAHGDRFRPAESLSEMVRDQRRFYPA
jgi:3-hydroxyacyl-CoA dehydrogenase/enoyl-CoA hydratase/3-hydroxybutyryl-CoA epimerase